jgi:hypothetical protein
MAAFTASAPCFAVFSSWSFSGSAAEVGRGVLEEFVFFINEP